MKYYRVKNNYDNYTRYKWGTGKKYGHVIPDGILIGNELYTENERNKIANRNWYFNEVEISKKDIYFLFGARFEK